MALIRVAGPDIEPVSVAEAKTHCRVDISNDDLLIANLITTAREYIEMICRPRRALISQTWKLLLDKWPKTDILELGVVPLLSVTSVAYTDDYASTTIWPASNYVVDTASEPGRLRLRTGVSWPSATLREVNGVEITFVAGYGASSMSVPEPFRQAILLLVGNWYENREVQIVSGAMPKQLEFAVNALLAPWRMEVW